MSGLCGDAVLGADAPAVRPPHQPELLGPRWDPSPLERLLMSLQLHVIPIHHLQEGWRRRIPGTWDIPENNHWLPAGWAFRRLLPDAQTGSSLTKFCPTVGRAWLPGIERIPGKHEELSQLKSCSSFVFLMALMTLGDGKLSAPSAGGSGVSITTEARG